MRIYSAILAPIFASLLVSSFLLLILGQMDLERVIEHY